MQSEKPEKKLELKGRITVDADICCLCNQNKSLPETASGLLDKHEQLNSELSVCKNVNKHLKEKVAKLEKVQAMPEQYSQRNNTELAGILNSIRDNDLEQNIISNCKENGIDISLMDTEAWHRLPLSNAQATKVPNQYTRAITKFVKNKLPEHLLQIKK